MFVCVYCKLDVFFVVVKSPGVNVIINNQSNYHNLIWYTTEALQCFLKITKITHTYSPDTHTWTHSAKTSCKFHTHLPWPQIFGDKPMTHTSLWVSMSPLRSFVIFPVRPGERLGCFVMSKQQKNRTQNVLLRRKSSQPQLFFYYICNTLEILTDSDLCPSRKIWLFLDHLRWFWGQ